MAAENFHVKFTGLMFLEELYLNLPQKSVKTDTIILP